MAVMSILLLFRLVSPFGHDVSGSFSDVHPVLPFFVSYCSNAAFSLVQLAEVPSRRFLFKEVRMMVASHEGKQ